MQTNATKIVKYCTFCLGFLINALYPLSYLKFLSTSSILKIGFSTCSIRIMSETLPTHELADSEKVFIM
jgi:hypothetical protein